MPAVEMATGRTEAPALIAEDELIKQMDRGGIGTDATMASHIKTVLDRGYAALHAADSDEDDAEESPDGRNEAHDLAGAITEETKETSGLPDDTKEEEKDESLWQHVSIKSWPGGATATSQAARRERRASSEPSSYTQSTTPSSNT